MKGFFSLLLAGILFGLSGVLAKMLSDSFTAYETMFLRFVIAFGCAFLIYLFYKKPISFGNVSKENIILFSILFPVSVLLFIVAIYHTKVALVVFGYYIADAIGSYSIGYFWLREKLDVYRISGLLLLFVSLLFFTNIFHGFLVDTGFLLALGSGIVNSVASYFKKIIKGQATVLNLTLLQAGTGAVLAACVMLFSNSFFTLPVQTGDVWVVILYGVLFVGIIYLMIYGFQHFDLNVGSIVVSSELLFGPLFAFLILHEQLTQLEIIGSCIVIIAIVVSNVDFSRFQVGVKDV